ncbi:SDR family NAD(P)-dependent oxidoreductase [Saccharothrix australiensis]|uniref:Probable oxidoreductase n=1 Tax=Saccharothrix australiensis TaxID=2072 RepID=A0A495VZY0_9PSEU|nr:SDR family NAD(P)-dependent oxidoreductase [Saccharothrix australiensis]RKT54317.1 NAD(P)-dependent dehydrogenase (short-subunit alcohol dehydrogenase family) [Saccharothrix australiensis]
MSERISTPFDAESTASDVLAGVDLTGRRAVVTGASSGIGVETARALAAAGAEVTLAVRDTAAGRRTADDIAGTTGNRALHVAPLDLADRASVAAFTANWDGPLHILVNNAGIMGSPETRTPEGWELQFATNHLGHFALTTGLHRALAAEGARVAVVSSVAHLGAGVDFEDIHFHQRPYSPWVAYSQSKTANILFAIEAHKRWADDGISVNALAPGVIMTNLQRYLTPEELEQVKASVEQVGVRWKTAEQGAATSALVAASPLLDGVGGRYFEDCREAGPADAEQPREGVAAHALDPEAAARLWEVSEQAR